MEKIPTAEERFEEFFSTFPRHGVYLAENWKKEIIEIANKLANDKSKFYVEAALKQASKKVTCSEEYQYDEYDNPFLIAKINRDSILNSYPLENIK